MSGDDSSAPGSGNESVVEEEPTKPLILPALPPPLSYANCSASNLRLRLNPNKEHESDSYEDMEELEFCPFIFSSLEKYLPSTVLESTREEKVKFMREILLKYLPHGELVRGQDRRDYRQKITSNYQPLNRGLYTVHPGTFFLPSFIKAVNEGTEESLRSIISEPYSGVFTFEIFQPRFCDLLLQEIEHFQSWVNEFRFRIMRPNIMNKYGAVLDDFGLETMLDKLMGTFICPLSKVFFPDVGGATLDTHHGFVVEYGKDKDLDLGLHVDDAEVTLNVCLGKQFSGGELFFRGTRCDKHVKSVTRPEESFDFCHVPGRAVLHRGRHRHGARATTSGQRINLLLWCRSSTFREMKKYQKDYCSWCGECVREKKELQRASIEAMKKELLRSDDGSSSLL